MTHQPAAPIMHARRQYFDAIMAGNRDAAVSLSLKLYSEGTRPEIIITDVISWAQSQVGKSWQLDQASIAAEHRASGITEYVLHSLQHLHSLTPGVVAPGVHGKVTLISAEGEWHTLPGRLASAVLEMQGYAVEYVGPSIPADDLPNFFVNAIPPVAAISCAMQISLAGAWRTVTVLRELGTRVLAGGRGFGKDGRWADVIGADFFADDFRTGAQILIDHLHEQPVDPRPGAGDPIAIRELYEMEPQLDVIVDRVVNDISERVPEALERTGREAALTEDVRGCLKSVLSALITSDFGVILDYDSWLRAMLEARSLPVNLGGHIYESLTLYLPGHLYQTQSLTMRARDLY